MEPCHRTRFPPPFRILTIIKGKKLNRKEQKVQSVFLVYKEAKKGVEMKKGEDSAIRFVRNMETSLTKGKKFEFHKLP